MLLQACSHGDHSLSDEQIKVFQICEQIRRGVELLSPPPARGMLAAPILLSEPPLDCPVLHPPHRDWFMSLGALWVIILCGSCNKLCELSADNNHSQRPQVHLFKVKVQTLTPVISPQSVVLIDYLPSLTQTGKSEGKPLNVIQHHLRTGGSPSKPGSKVTVRKYKHLQRCSEFLCLL